MFIISIRVQLSFLARLHSNRITSNHTSKKSECFEKAEAAFVLSNNTSKICRFVSSAETRSKTLRSLSSSTRRITSGKFIFTYHRRSGFRQRLLRPYCFLFPFYYYVCALKQSSVPLRAPPSRDRPLCRTNDKALQRMRRSERRQTKITYIRRIYRTR